MIWILLLTSLLTGSGRFVRIEGDLSGIDLTVRPTSSESIVIRGLSYLNFSSGDTLNILLQSSDENTIMRIGIIKRAARIDLPREREYEFDLTLHSCRFIFYDDSLSILKFNLHTEAGYVQLLFKRKGRKGGDFTLTGTLSTIEIINPGEVEFSNFRVDCGASRIILCLLDRLKSPIRLFSTLGSVTIRTKENSWIRLQKSGFLNIGPGNPERGRFLGNILFRGSVNRIKREVLK
ncbi:MAG TPA: hypothetical protein ENG67_06240 [candidate division WOR-3 bacterium]|uniref:Uncharacterized protein n=1 Tax=candidate division WOR-3 bacterium TaxID=2052148 RepID=A0A7C0XBK2_UNCW3|nr:MAG: hypothetical protein DRQ04_06035 [Candidatus Hydrothermae bacterium]HDM90785.1 hypothetical protein [candidate division WOR-3 bacterium]